MRLSMLIEMLSRFRHGWATDPEVVVDVDGKLYPVVGYHFTSREDDAMLVPDKPKMIIQTKVRF